MLSLAKVASNQKHIEQCPLFLVWVADISRNQRLGAEEGVTLETMPYQETFLVAAIDADVRSGRDRVSTLQQELTEQLTKLRADLLMTAQQAQLTQKNLKETQGGLRQARAEGAKLTGRLKDLEG